MKKNICAIIFIVSVLLYGREVYPQSNFLKIVDFNVGKEYVLIKNEGNSTINLKDWVLHDHDYGKANVYSYTFNSLELQPNEVLQMQSGKLKNKNGGDEQENKLSDVTYYIRWSDRNVWNNSCDIAYLLDDTGKLIAEQHAGKDIAKGKKDSCR